MQPIYTIHKSRRVNKHNQAAEQGTSFLDGVGIKYTKGPAEAETQKMMKVFLLENGYLGQSLKKVLKFPQRTVAERKPVKFLSKH